MNYLSEILAFYNWLEMNPMQASAIDLWHALLYTANKSGWASEFSVPISMLKIRTGLNKDAIYRARNTLTQMGLIEYRTRSGNQSAVYKLCSIASLKPTQGATQTATQEELVSEIATQTATQPATQTATQPATHTATQGATQPATQAATINKLNTTKRNKMKLTPSRPPKGDAPEPVPRETVQYKKIADYWNSVCTELPKVQAMSDNRKKALRARVKEHGEETVLRVIALVKQSDFLCGRTGNSWNASFDWVMKPTNFVKVLEGNYTNKAPVPPTTPGTARSVDDLTDNPFLKIAMEEEMKNE
ncbi:hypothetical protein [Eubacterium maltosivorans]|uniref:hypothetical protein n=1 Tax=Eubacterium maltosivorans TaxID=2041044 RepID=UPI003A8FA5B4